MKGKRYALRGLSIPLMLVGIILGVDTIINVINPMVTLPWESLVYSLFITGVFLLIGNVFLILSFSSIEVRRRLSEMFIKAIFVLYCIAAIIVLFGNGTFSRQAGESFSYNAIIGSTNIVPFRSICGYVHALCIHKETSIALENLIGNLILFSPMGFFLPHFQKNARKAVWFTCESVLILMLIEMLQLSTTRGVCDIDDVILNLAGALLVWVICSTKSVRKLQQYMGIVEK